MAAAGSPALLAGQRDMQRIATRDRKKISSQSVTAEPHLVPTARSPMSLLSLQSH